VLQTFRSQTDQYNPHQKKSVSRSVPIPLSRNYNGDEKRAFASPTRQPSGPAKNPPASKRDTAL
jgi:hypothetical protein